RPSSSAAAPRRRGTGRPRPLPPGTRQGLLRSGDSRWSGRRRGQAPGLELPAGTALGRVAEDQAAAAADRVSAPGCFLLVSYVAIWLFPDDTPVYGYPLGQLVSWRVRIGSPVGTRTFAPS